MSGRGPSCSLLGTTAPTEGPRPRTELGVLLWKARCVLPTALALADPAQGTRGPSWWVDRDQTCLSVCDILFILLDECTHFLNREYNPELVIPSSKHQCDVSVYTDVFFCHSRTQTCGQGGMEGSLLTLDQYSLSGAPGFVHPPPPSPAW